VVINTAFSASPWEPGSGQLSTGREALHLKATL